MVMAAYEMAENCVLNIEQNWLNFQMDTTCTARSNNQCLELFICIQICRDFVFMRAPTGLSYHMQCNCASNLENGYTLNKHVKLMIVLCIMNWL